MLVTAQGFLLGFHKNPQPDACAGRVLGRTAEQERSDRAEVRHLAEFPSESAGGFLKLLLLPSPQPARPAPLLPFYPLSTARGLPTLALRQGLYQPSELAFPSCC